MPGGPPDMANGVLLKCWPYSLEQGTQDTTKSPHLPITDSELLDSLQPLRDCMLFTHLPALFSET
eukprot:210586-Amphidinium_carterae.2